MKREANGEPSGAERWAAGPQLVRRVGLLTLTRAPEDTVSFLGDLEGRGAPQLLPALLPLLPEGPSVTLDFTFLGSVDEEGLQALVQAISRVSELFDKVVFAYGNQTADRVVNLLQEE